MPSEFIIDSVHGVVFSRGTGVFTYQDFLEHMVRLKSDPGFHAELNQIVDCRAITMMDLTTKQVADLADRSGFSLQSRRAFVVSTDLQYGLSRVFAAYREIKGGEETRVFRTLSEALGWLSLPENLDPFSTEKNSAGA